MPRCFLKSVKPLQFRSIQEYGNNCVESDVKPGRLPKPQAFKRQKTLLKCNETVYHDKVPISTRFYLQLLKRSQFLSSFVDTETYDYASESERTNDSPDSKRTIAPSRKDSDKSTYNLRSMESKSERKIFTERTRAQRKMKNSNVANVQQMFNPSAELKLNEVKKKKLRKEPLAPIIEEIKNREMLKCSNRGGTEIDKIAEKLKNLVKTHADERLNKELLYCKESFDEKNLEPPPKLEEKLSEELKDCQPAQSKPDWTERRVRASHVCSYCGKGFDRPWVLKGHLRLHTGERPFPCPQPTCGRTFSDRSNLRAHQRTRGHHSWQWRCSECGKAFSQRRYLERHRDDACRKYRMHSRNGTKYNRAHGAKSDPIDAMAAPPVPLYGIVCHGGSSQPRYSPHEFIDPHPEDAHDQPIDLSIGRRHADV
ncbi:unnamed protein product, partial [Iphiclides podalirius]